MGAPYVATTTFRITDYGLASVTRTPALFSPAASFLGGAASQTSSSISASAHTRSKWTRSYFELSSSRIVRSERSIIARLIEQLNESASVTPSGVSPPAPMNALFALNRRMNSSASAPKAPPSRGT